MRRDRPLGRSQHRADDAVGRAVAVGEGLDVDDHPLAHRDAALDRRRAHMRQQHDIVERGEARVDRRLVLEHVEAGAGDRAGLEQSDRSSSSTISPRAVLTRIACGRSSLMRRADSR
jgi:hypothetical protein